MDVLRGGGSGDSRSLLTFVEGDDFLVRSDAGIVARNVEPRTNAGVFAPAPLTGESLKPRRVEDDCFVSAPVELPVCDLTDDDCLGRVRRAVKLDIHEDLSLLDFFLEPDTRGPLSGWSDWTSSVGTTAVTSVELVMLCGSS